MPTDKRARHKAARQAKMAELRRTQQRRKTLKRGGVVAIFVVIALVLALYSSHTFPFTKSHSTNVSTSTGSSSTTTDGATTTTSLPTTSTTLDTTAPEALSAVEADLVARAAPAHSADCTNPDAGSASATTTTIPAKGNQVATIAAPANVGFPDTDQVTPHYTKFSAAPPFCINVDSTYKATVTTTAGTFVITLLPKYAPVTVNNFVFLAGYHYFDGIVFHRIVTDFIDQSGDPTGTGEGGPGYKFDDELPKSAGAYDAGSVSMANSGANTNGSQFFVTVGTGGQQLEPSYSMFGQVTSGMKTVEEINAAGSSSSEGTPTKLYKILSVHVTTT